MSWEKIDNIDEGFAIPVNLFSPDREALDFIQSVLSDKGWFSPGRKAPVHTNTKSPAGYRRDFWVTEGSLSLFKEDLKGACLPFNLEPHFLQDNVVAITEIKGGS